MLDPASTTAAGSERIIKLAVLAVGGQGGGVLAGWITEVAERNGYLAQATSVAGVAQRTGATIYYVEMCRDSGRLPVFALSPAQGDVDILIAAELMEAGRAIMRGFVTPDRTTLIASAHRIPAVSEKIEPGDGLASPTAVLIAAETAALRFIAFDMERIAREVGSVVSSSLLGALAGSGTLPFPRESYEEAVAASGRGAKASLAAFSRAFDAALSDGASLPVAAPPAADRHRPAPGVSGPASQVQAWRGLASRVEDLPEAVRDMAARGLRKVVDYQDVGYGGEYLDRVDRAIRLDGAACGFALSVAAAKHLANAMCYDDVIRVADLKTRSARDRRVRRDVGLAGTSVLQTTEYFHPRVDELLAVLPSGLGRFLADRPGLCAFIDRGVNRGRRIRTSSIVGFTGLWLVGGLRRWRRQLLRHQQETAHLERWYRLALDHAADDYALAVEILNCRRLIKGYSDTHARGRSKFDQVLSGLDLVRGRQDAADWIRRLREAALKDEDGTMLAGALRTVASLSDGAP